MLLEELLLGFSRSQEIFYANKSQKLWSRYFPLILNKEFHCMLFKVVVFYVWLMEKNLNEFIGALVLVGWKIKKIYGVAEK